MMQKKKLLIISDSPLLNTGLARICKEISIRLFDKYEIAIAGWHHIPKRHNFPMYIYPIVKDNPEQIESQTRSIIADFEPDIVLCIGDIWDFSVNVRIFSQCREINENFRCVLWTTVDGEWSEIGWSCITREFDLIVSMSKFGINEIKKLTSRFIDTELYPGVDEKTFFPLNYSLKSENIDIDLENTFSILNIGQNCDRKNIPATISAFAEFQKDKKDVFLFVATNADSPVGHNIWNIIKHNNLSKNVTVVKNISPIDGIKDNRINLLYNICKVNLNTSIGEGLCLPVLEGMAAGCVPIATNYAAVPELIKNTGLAIDAADYIYGAYGVIRAIPSKKDLINKLELLYQDWKKYKNLEDKSNSIYFNLKKKCIEESKQYRWEKTIQDLDKILEKAFIAKKRDYVKSTLKLDELKLVMVIPSWGKNCGIAEYTKYLGQHIEKLGVKVTIFNNNRLEELIPHLDKFNCVYIQHEYSFFQNRNDLENFFDKAREKNVKTVILMHSFAPFFPYLNMCIDKADVVLFHNETFKKLAMKQRPDAINVQVVPMGCFTPHKKDDSNIKNILNIADKYPIIGSFGFLRDQKGYNELVLAIKEMRQQYPNILCLIVAPPHEFGSRAYDESFFRFIEDEGMQNNILIIREYLDEEKLLKTLNVCDLFVLNYKDAPNMGGNSAACKTLMRLCKPIIAPDSIAFLDVNEEVLKIKGLNKESIIVNINKLLSDKELYKKVSLNAEAFLNKNDWSNVVKQHINFCKNN